MRRIKNKESGVVHAEGKMYLTLCGTFPIHSRISDEKVTCKTCIRMLRKKEARIRLLKKEEKKKRTCRLPSCTYYSVSAPGYCCAACAADAYDNERLSIEERNMKAKKVALLREIDKMIASHRSNFPIKMEKKSPRIWI